MEPSEFNAAPRLNIDQAAAHVGMSPSELRARIASGDGPSLDLYRGLRWIRLDELRRWVQARGVSLPHTPAS